MHHHSLLSTHLSHSHYNEFKNCVDQKSSFKKFRNIDLIDLRSPMSHFIPISFLQPEIIFDLTD